MRDEGVPGMVVRLSAPAFSEIALPGRKSLSAGGGAKLGQAISTSVREGLAGLEALVGIPGTIGGALHGNAGSRGGDIGQWTCQATVMTRDRRDHRTVARGAGVRLSRKLARRAGDPRAPSSSWRRTTPEELTKRMQKQWIVKKASQPLGHQSAGCIFKNPRGMSAGMLIEQAGLKGTRARAGRSQRAARQLHRGRSTAPRSQDVLRLIELVRSRVAERLGVELETEIEIW